MDSKLQRAREAVASLGKRGRTTRISDEVRRTILAYVRLARRRGVSWRQIAEEVGVSATAMSRWGGADRPRKKTKLRSVRLVPGKPSLDFTVSVVTSTGLRIEGLRVADAIEVARALG